MNDHKYLRLIWHAIAHPTHITAVKRSPSETVWCHKCRQTFGEVWR